MSTLMLLSSDPFRAAIPGEADLRRSCEDDPDGFGVRVGSPAYEAAAAVVARRF